MKQFFLTTYTSPATIATTLELFPKEEIRAAEQLIEEYLEALFWFLIESSVEPSEKLQLSQYIHQANEHAILTWIDSHPEIQSAFEEASDRHILKIRTNIQEAIS